MVVGAGVVGLAIARAFARRGLETLVLEAAGAIGSGISSRSSEVVHAGIYYPNGSLKARLCVRGRELLYAYCRDRGIRHSVCGKVIVAADEGQAVALADLMRRAERNGIAGLEWRTGAQVRAMEPELKCHTAILSPVSGILDSHELMIALQGDLEHAGGAVVCSSAVAGGHCSADGITLRVGAEKITELKARIVVNAAGFGAQSLAHSLDNLPPASIPPLYFAKGSYFVLNGRSPFSRLVYPLPEPGGLGIHMTLDLAGQARFGPDVEWIDRPDFEVSAERVDYFYDSIRRYWPGLPNGALRAGYAGVRPKLGPATAPAADFIIQGPQVHGICGLVNLYGIESPGLTAALAIAEYVASMISPQSPASRKMK